MFGLLIGLLGLILAGAAPSPIAVRLLGGLGVVLAVAYVWRGVRIGVDIHHASVVVHGAWKSDRVAVDDIAGVGTHP
jgi:hypothetical protein